MTHQSIDSIKSVFISRLDTLDHILQTAERHFGDDASWIDARIAPDMFPLGTQVAFTCNQPRNFALWCQGKPMDNLPESVSTTQLAHEHVADTKKLVMSVSVGDAKLAEMKRVELGPTMYVDLPGNDYVADFLMPNFYFHLVTTYDILRMIGLSLGKKDFMLHLLPHIRQR
jgi:hypothetical protein